MPLGFILGMAGLLMMIGGSMTTVRDLKNGEYYDALAVKFIIALVGFAFFAAWLMM